ncbi:MAG: F0F1 ATP synthase subunit delta [Sarcina sp.]
MKEYLDRRYAIALYEIAKEHDSINEIILEFGQVCDILDEHKELKEIIEHPQISSSEKKSVLKSIFKDKINKDLYNFLELIIDKDRTKELRGVFDQVEDVLLVKSNKVKATVKTCVKLDEEQRKLLIEKLENKYHKEVILEEKIDESIIGGVYLKVGNDVIDGTLSHQYTEMEEAILNNK